MRSTYCLSVILLSLFISLGLSDQQVYSNGQLYAPFTDFSWATTRSASDTTVPFQGQAAYSFAPSSYTGLYFVCQSCINGAQGYAIIMYVNYGTNINTVLSVSVVRNSNSGTTNYPPMTSPLSLSTFATSTITANTWIKFVIPFTSLALGSFDGIQLIGTTNAVQSTMYVGSITIGKAAASLNYLNINGTKTFALGVDMPYTPYNFGLDFGKNNWGYTGVNSPSTFSNASSIFKQINKNNGNTVRWNLFTDARAGIIFDVNGYPIALNAEVYSDIDKAILLAKGYRVSICFSILDITFLQLPSVAANVTLGGHTDVVSDPTKTAAFLKNVITPIIKRYGNNPSIFAWEIMNDVEKVIFDLPDGTPAPVTAFNLVTMAEFWPFINTIATGIKALTTIQQVTMGSLSLKWINLYTPTYASQNNLPSLNLDFYTVGYDTWMDSVRYFNDSVLGTVYGSPFQQDLGLLNIGAPVVVSGISTNSYNFSTLYNLLVSNGYAGVFESYSTINWVNFRLWGSSNTEITLWSTVVYPTFPAINSTTPTPAPTPAPPVPTYIPTAIPTNIRLQPTVIYADGTLNSQWADRSWAPQRSSVSKSYSFVGNSSYGFDPSAYAGIFLYSADAIDTGSDYAITFYVNGGITSGTKLAVSITDEFSKKIYTVSLDSLTANVLANVWTKVILPLNVLPLGSFSGIQIYGTSSATQGNVYIDEVVLLSLAAATSTGSPSTTTTTTTSNSTTNSTNPTVDAVMSPAISLTFNPSLFTLIIVFVSTLVNLVFV